MVAEGLGFELTARFPLVAEHPVGTNQSPALPRRSFLRKFVPRSTEDTDFMIDADSYPVVE